MVICRYLSTEFWSTWWFKMDCPRQFSIWVVSILEEYGNMFYYVIPIDQLAVKAISTMQYYDRRQVLCWKTSANKNKHIVLNCFLLGPSTNFTTCLLKLWEYFPKRPRVLGLFSKWLTKWAKHVVLSAKKAQWEMPLWAFWRCGQVGWKSPILSALSGDSGSLFLSIECFKLYNFDTEKKRRPPPPKKKKRNTFETTYP